jgi:hypothetical protein
MQPEQDLAGRAASALQLAELLLDAVDAALPLTDHRPAETALVQLELLATGADVFSWDGAPGWDVVLARGLLQRAPLAPGPSILDGLGAQAEREGQRGELKRRARAEATRLLAACRAAAALPTPNAGSAAPGAVVAAHASLLRLLGCAASSSLLFLAEDLQAGPLPPPAEEALVREMDERAAAGSDFAAAQEEWLGRLLHDNPAAAVEPAFRTYFAGLSQALRVALSLREFRDEARAGSLAKNPEALLGALGGWQPVRWAQLRHGAPSSWVEQLCPAAPPGEPPLSRLARECSAGLDLAGRLWAARGLSLTGFTALASLLVARCASIVALWEELGG